MHMIGPRCRERFLSLLAKGPLAELGVRQSGISDLRGHYYMSRPQPSFFLLLGTLAGQAQLQTETGERLLKTGDVLFAPAGVPYRYDTLRGKRWRIIWFHFQPPSWMQAFKSVRITSTALLPKLTEEAEDILKETSVSTFLAMQARRAKEAYISVMIERLFHQDQPGKQGRYEPIIYQLWRRVMEDLPRLWTLADLATIAGFSAGHLNRICRQYYGRPAMKQLTLWRLEHAAHILRHGELKIDAIAGLCGYANAFAFSVAFKRHFGCPPSRFEKVPVVPSGHTKPL